MNISRFLRGDIWLWGAIILLMMLSLLLIYSTASHNIYTMKSTKSTESILIKHFVHLVLGFLIIWGVHLVKSKWVWYIAPFSWIIALGLIILAGMQNTVIGGVDASRWIEIPGIGISFQPSSLGILSLILYYAWFMSWSRNKTEMKMKTKYLYLGIPLGSIVTFVFIHNLSTALLIGIVSMVVLFVAGFSRKHFSIIILSVISLATTLFFLAKSFPALAPSRLQTWISRIDRFGADSSTKDTYQVDNAKIAIAQGEWFGLGPGKSTFKNLLPQSSSDFVFAIIVEEYGIIFSVLLLVIYIVIFLRISKIAMQTDRFFNKIMVFGIGFFTIVQAFINSGVAVELLPTTGQPLPLISSGGSFIWITCASLGLVLSVSREEQIRKNKQKKAAKNSTQSIDENSNSTNPIDAVLNK